MTRDLAPDEQGASAPAPANGVALPEAVRTRVLALAADALARLAPEHLPPALKRVATFAPTRRAKLAGGLIQEHLEADEQFRERVATQVEATVGDLARAVVDGSAPEGVDAVEVAAAAYLLRPEGWQVFVEEAAELQTAARRVADERRAEEQVLRLRRRLDDLEADLQQGRARSREQVDRLKAENSELRHKLGDVRVRLRQAEDTAAGSLREAESRTADAQRLQAAAEAEVRRLRARVQELEGDLADARRSDRAAKAGESLRARLLMDTLVDAASGLRRELGLPAADRMPADTVVADVATPGSRASSGRGSLPVDDPALLEELLRLPRAHLVVDGYNVTKTTWPELPLDRQRERLLTGAAALQARTSAELTVVFDAAETRDRPLVAPPRGVRVLFSPYGVIADDVIRDLVAAEPPGRSVVVASSDQAVARDVAAAGFRVVAAATLAGVLGARGS
jgi:predicted RNA-binding protein with PIN domain